MKKSYGTFGEAAQAAMSLENFHDVASWWKFQVGARLLACNQAGFPPLPLLTNRKEREATAKFWT